MLTQCTQVSGAIRNAFFAGFRSLYPQLIEQLSLLMILMKSNQYPDICQAVAQQISGVKSFSQVFDNPEHLKRVLPELLEMSTASEEQLSGSDAVPVPPTLQLLAAIEMNMLSHVARHPKNAQLTKLLMEHTVDVLHLAAKQATALAQWSHTAEATVVIRRINDSSLLGVPVSQLLAAIQALPALDLVSAASDEDEDAIAAASDEDEDAIAAASDVLPLLLPLMMMPLLLLVLLLSLLLLVSLPLHCYCWFLCCCPLFCQACCCCCHCYEYHLCCFCNLCYHCPSAVFFTSQQLE